MFQLLSLILALLLGFVTPTRAGDSLAAPSGPVVLEVTGKIENTNAESKALLDIDAFKQVGSVNIQTTTPWTEGETKFEGVSAEALLAKLGATGSEVTATAADNYSVTIPIDDLKNGKAILAYKMNGQDLPADQYGPLWIVYPYDSDPALNDDLHHSRSIWQIKKLDVK